MQTEKRSKLSAIMFTDIFGYSGTMERDERQAMETLERHNQLLLPLIHTFGGDIIDAIGEGFLVVFDSAFNACNCGLNIQKAIAQRNRAAGETERLLVRIGIHQGDIWYDDKRIYGNGVNVAARLLPLAPPGGICVSEDVYRQFKNKTEVQFHRLGRKKLKGMEEQFLVYELVTGSERRDMAERQAPEGQKDLSDLVQTKIEEGRIKAREALGGNQKQDQSENRIENRILGFVEKVMDKAVDKWESLPDEKRKEIIQGIKKETWYSNTDFQGEGKGNSRKKKKAKEEDEDYKELIPVGVVATSGFGAALALTAHLWLVFPLVLVGLIPLGIGISHLVSWRRKKAEEKEQLPFRREGEAIAAAGRHGGKLTVMQLSAEEKIPLEEAEKVLDGMAKKGYIGQVIEESGMISYEFPELLDGPEQGTEESENS